ncbi:hypothetical protein [Paraburkholderia xenovorans]|uniref:hypothetical protein n=1 Tax=Paraburkholderia xenovorans TaxID=36873 RepID=UPI0038B8639C
MCVQKRHYALEPRAVARIVDGQETLQRERAALRIRGELQQDLDEPEPARGRRRVVEREKALRVRA